jgi:hypothetical protein
LEKWRDSVVNRPLAWDVFSYFFNGLETKKLVVENPKLQNIILANIKSKEQRDTIMEYFNQVNFTIEDIMIDTNQSKTYTKKLWSYLNNMGFRLFFYSTLKFITSFDDISVYILNGLNDSLVSSTEKDNIIKEIAIIKEMLNNPKHYIHEYIPTSDVTLTTRLLEHTHRTLLNIIRVTVFDEYDDNIALPEDGIDEMTDLLEHISGHFITGLPPQTASLEDIKEKINYSLGIDTDKYDKFDPFETYIPPFTILAPWKSSTVHGDHKWGELSNINVPLLSLKESRVLYRHDFILIFSVHELLKGLLSLFTYYNYRYGDKLKKDEVANLVALRTDLMTQFIINGNFKKGDTNITAETLKLLSIKDYERNIESHVGTNQTLHGPMFSTSTTNPGSFGGIVEEGENLLTFGSKVDKTTSIPLNKISYRNLQCLLLSYSGYDYLLDQIREATLKEMWHGDIYMPFTKRYKDDINKEKFEIERELGKESPEKIIEAYYRNQSNDYMGEGISSYINLPTLKIDIKTLQDKYNKQYLYIEDMTVEEINMTLNQVYSTMLRGLAFLMYTKTNIGKKKLPNKAKITLFIAISCLKLMIKYYNPYISVKLLEMICKFDGAPEDGKIVNNMTSLIDEHEKYVHRINQSNKDTLVLSKKNIPLSKIGILNIKPKDDSITEIGSQIVVDEIVVDSYVDSIKLKQMKTTMDWMRVTTLHSQIMSMNVIFNKKNREFTIKSGTGEKNENGIIEDSNRLMYFQLLLRRSIGDFYFEYPLKSITFDVDALIREGIRFLNILQGDN